MLPTELQRLVALSARIGRDVLLTQGSSGNTSYKDGDLLWVKASGKWLADAVEQPIFVPVRQPCARRRVWQGLPVDLECVPDGYRELKPSIEAAMHAVLPHRVVLHVHSVNTIAIAVQAQATAVLGEKLSGLRWAFVPYMFSGLPLAQAIWSALARAPETTVFVLGNHGLVVCGESCQEAEDLLANVEARLRVAPRTSTAMRCEHLTTLGLSAANHVLPPHPVVHALATDDASRATLANGVLYPCQAIFLNGSQPWQQSVRDHGAGFQIFPRKGVLVRANIPAGDYEALVGLAEVVQRIPPGTPLRYLTADEVQGAEACSSYRESANRQPAAQLA